MQGYQGLISFHQGTIISNLRISQSQTMHSLTQTSRQPKEAAGAASWHFEPRGSRRGVSSPFWKPLKEATKCRAYRLGRGSCSLWEILSACLGFSTCFQRDIGSQANSSGDEEGPWQHFLAPLSISSANWARGSGSLTLHLTLHSA